MKAFAKYSEKRQSFKKISKRVNNAYSAAIKEACFVAISGEDIVGYSLVRKMRKNKEAYLSLLAVVPEFQRSKMGGKLLKKSLSVLKKKKIKKVTLNVPVTFRHAIKFYEKHGFDKNSYRMERKL